MNDNDIIKALECCSYDDVKMCDDCPYYEKETKTYCANDLIKDTFDLINRLEKTNRKNERIIELADKTIETQKAEIERLQNTLDDVLDREPVLVERSEKYAKSEAIKEFAERLKDKYKKPFFYLGSYEQFMREVDNLVKGMTEEKE